MHPLTIMRMTSWTNIMVFISCETVRFNYISARSRNQRRLRMPQIKATTRTVAHRLRVSEGHASDVSAQLTVEAFGSDTTPVCR